MADESGAGPAAPNGDVPAGAGPQATIVAQYVKDLSFENPNSPAIYQTQTQPKIDVQFDIGRAQAPGDGWEVVLRIQITAKIEEQTAFHVELTYAGLFQLRNFPEDQIQPFLLIDGPSMLFPYARRIASDAIRDGGFQPLMLDPIDFAGLYLQQQAQMEQQDGGNMPPPQDPDA